MSGSSVPPEAPSTPTSSGGGAPDSGESSLLLGESVEEPGLSPAENSFRRLCVRVLQRIGGAEEDDDEPEDPDAMPELEGSEKLDPERAVRAQIPTALREYNAASRALAAHLLLAVTAFHLTQARTELEFYRLMTRQRVDMQTAWELLDLPHEGDAYETRQLDVLRIQVAQCLRDAGRMQQIMNRISQTPAEQLNIEEVRGEQSDNTIRPQPTLGALLNSCQCKGRWLASCSTVHVCCCCALPQTMLLYTAAPLLGRWDDCVRFGELLRSKFPNSDAIHSSSSMDYAELWRMAHEQRAHGNAKPSEIVWRDYTITNQRIRLLQAQCANPTILAELEAQFSGDDGSGSGAEGGRPWQPLEVGDSSELVRCGALAQCKSFSPAGIPLVGPADSRSIWVAGSFEMSDGRSVQHETWRLRRVARREMQGDPQAQDEEGGDFDPAEECWIGTYTLVQREREDEATAAAAPSGVPPLATLTCQFDLELTLVPRPSHAEMAAQAEQQQQHIQEHVMQQHPPSSSSALADAAE